MKKESKRWSILASDYLHKEPWCTLRKDRVMVSNGAIIPDYYILEYPDWINVIAKTKTGKYIFVYQYRHGLQQHFYELTAGVCDATDKSPLETAQRELLEETGYGKGNWELLSVLSANPSTHTNLCYCYVATDVEKISEQHLDDAEDLEVVELDLDEVKQLLLDDKIMQSLHAAPLWKYMAINKLL